MIRKLRRKFILTNMLLVSLVLLIVFAALVGSNYQKLSGQVDGALGGALLWRDEPPPRMEIIAAVPVERSRPVDRGRSIAVRMVSLIPVFTVTLDESGAVSDYNRGNSVDLSDETAEQVAALVRDGADSGTVPGMSLRYLREIGPDGVERIAFADLTWLRDSMAGLVLTSLLVGLAALGCFLLISMLLSRLALRPVEAAWEQQRRFVADASHELKTPLTVILTNVGILLSHRWDTVEGQLKWVEYIREEAQRMRTLVEDLLFLAKGDGAGGQETSLLDTDLSELCWSVLLAFEPVAFEVGVTLDSHIAPDVTLCGRGDQLRRLAQILLDNAVKYTPSGGTARLNLAQEERGGIRLAVHNTGPAIAPEHMAHLFERFYRSDDSRARASGGYGLGLAIARSIAEGHGGSITVESDPETGTTFTVRLP